jgi:hypothetical protein
MARGVDEIRNVNSGELVGVGTVDIGKRLRPNFRSGRIVLFVTPQADNKWEAVRVT